MTARASEPGHDCPRCPRLVAFREEWRAREPAWFNGPVPAFGPTDARLLIVGLAPGLRGANRTGRPFTGDYAGDLLYATLIEFGFARGNYEARTDDGLTLVDCRIANAVSCVPPENKPTPDEINTCRPFLAAALAEMRSRMPFTHAGAHQAGKVMLFGSYHCSRYNTNTGRLTPEMFRAVFSKVRAHLND